MAPEQPPRVLHVVESWRPVVSGYSNRSWHIVDRQNRLGIARPEVLVTSRQGTYGVGKVDEPPGVSVTLLPATGAERAMRKIRPFHLERRALAEAVEQGARGCDLVHVHWSSGIGRAAAEGARRAGKPLVAEVRFDLAGAMATETLRGKAAWLEPWLRRHFEAHLQEAGAVVAASHSLADLLEHDCHVRREKISVVPNGVDPAPAAAFSCRDALRASLGLEQAFVVGTTSNMLRYENLGAILDAAAHVPRGHGLFVGDGPVRRELERQAKATGAAASFIGKVPPAEVPKYLAAMDVFAVPRLQATITRFASPLKVMEAMAMGCCVVATALGDVPGLLADGRGVLVPASDRHAFLKAVEALARDPRRRRDTGAKARAYVEKELNWDSTIGRYAQVYRGLL